MSKHTLRPFQKKDVAKILGKWKDRSVFLAHEMGLGKSAIALNCLEDAKRVLILCPASVRPVWDYEIKKWCPKHKNSIQVISSGEDIVSKQVRFIVCSYALAAQKSIGTQFLKLRTDIFICDESHCLGSIDTMRTKMCLGSLYKRATRSFFLSGSIQQDKIVNVWPIFRTLCPEYIPSYRAFCDKYTKAIDTGFGQKLVGNPDSIKDLGKIARQYFMIRRLKKHVAKELPEKMHQDLVIELPSTMQKKLAQASEEFKVAARRAIVTGIKPRQGQKISKLLRELGEEKVPATMEILLDSLGYGKSLESFEKVVVFCYHLSVYNKLVSQLNSHNILWSGIAGNTNVKARAKAVKDFQEVPDCKVFLGTYAAAEGITLTAANMILVAEMSWSLYQNEQMEDRVHRIGQEKNVWIKRILVKDTLDETVYKAYKQKKRDKDKAFNPDEQTAKKKTRKRS